MPHGHIFDVPEALIFIDSVLKGGVPLREGDRKFESTAEK
jgi:hypothetical protein